MTITIIIITTTTTTTTTTATTTATTTTLLIIMITTTITLVRLYSLFLCSSVTRHGHALSGRYLAGRPVLEGSQSESSGNVCYMEI